MDVVKELTNLKIGKVEKKPLLKNLTTYKVGGEALCLVTPNNIDDLKKLMAFIYKNNLKYKVLGNGSNLIFDGDYDGILIKLSNFDKFVHYGNEFIIGAGYSTIKAAMKVSKEGYTGLEFATGIPGTIGGAIYMNAGAYGTDMGYIVRSVKVLTPALNVITIYNRELNFHYRTSFLKEHPNFICLEANIILSKGDKDLIMGVIEDRRKRRVEAQPLEYPSAGSVFRNPKDDFAGRIVEELGYKGKSVGGAMVSLKHANFIINKGGATGKDIKTLIKNIQKDALDKLGVELILEQEIVN